MAKHSSLTVDYKNLAISTIKDKYPYFLLGLSVVLIAYLMIASIFIKPQTLKTVSKENDKIENAQTASVGKTVSSQVKKYVVKSGDHLWKIAEATYGSGYNAYDIALANKISNPSIIFAGQELSLPVITPKSPTTGEIVSAATEKITLKEAKYTVKEGDTLWKIALQAYGDGYAWSRIAEMNKITNPDIITTGQVISLPR